TLGFGGSVARQDERGFRQVHLPRNSLHLLVSQAAAVGKDCKLVPLQRTGGKHVKLHKRKLREFGLHGLAIISWRPRFSLATGKRKLETAFGGAWGPVILPVFKTGGRQESCRRWVRLPLASARTQTSLPFTMRSFVSLRISAAGSRPRCARPHAC